MSIQSNSELNDFYTKTDPWGYENNPEDQNRKAILMGELEKLPTPKRLLDIGCGHGFVTRNLPGDKVVGVDFSELAIKQADKNSKEPHINYFTADMFDLNRKLFEEPKGFDMIIITGVLYPQYIGQAKNIIYNTIDDLLSVGGYIISVHINQWYSCRFPYVKLKQLTYKYREFEHLLEVYQKV